MEALQQQTFLTEGKPPPYVPRCRLTTTLVTPSITAVIHPSSSSSSSAPSPHCALPAYIVDSEELVDDDLGDLEALVSGVTQTSQSTLLLKKRKEMREVDDALEFMKEQCVRGWRLVHTAAVCCCWCCHLTR